MRKRTEDTKNTIITAAQSLFLDKGYRLTSVDDIAVKAGMAKQTVYGYFADKRALFTAVIEKAVGTPWELHADTTPVKTLDDLAQALYAILSGINTVSMRPRYIKLLRTIISETAHQPELGDLFRNGVTYRSLQALTRIFVSANQAGITDISNPDLTARFFLGGIVVHIFLEGLLAHASVKKLSEAELREYITTFVYYLVPRNTITEGGRDAGTFGNDARGNS